MKKAKPAQIMLRKEFIDVKKNPRSEFFQVYGLVNENIQEWEIYVIGPPDTLYQNGVYKAIMRFPDEYPMRPPQLQFMCDMLHPNIYRDGKVCISTLQSGPEGADVMGHYWRPVLGIEQAILSVVSLLSDPNVDDPANTAAANLYKSDPNAFKQKCTRFAATSLSLVPKDFEYPVVKKQVDKKDNAEKREGLRPKTKSELFDDAQKDDSAKTVGLVGEFDKENEPKSVEDVNAKVKSDDESDFFEYDPEDLSENGYELESLPSRAKGSQIRKSLELKTKNKTNEKKSKGKDAQLNEHEDEKKNKFSKRDFDEDEEEERNFPGSKRRNASSKRMPTVRSSSTRNQGQGTGSGTGSGEATTQQALLFVESDVEFFDNLAAELSNVLQIKLRDKISSERVKIGSEIEKWSAKIEEKHSCTENIRNDLVRTTTLNMLEDKFKETDYMLPKIEELKSDAILKKRKSFSSRFGILKMQMLNFSNKSKVFDV